MRSALIVGDFTRDYRRSLRHTRAVWAVLHEQMHPACPADGRFMGEALDFVGQDEAPGVSEWAIRVVDVSRVRADVENGGQWAQRPGICRSKE